MSKRYFLLNKTDNKEEQKLALVGQLFLKLDGMSAQISENGGPVLVFVQDDVITVKIEAEVKDLFFNLHPVKKGGLYFLESSDKLIYKNSQIEVVSADALTESFSNFDAEKTSLQITNSLKKDKTQSSHTSEDIVFKVDKKHETTRTSIDINELLAKAKSNKSNQKKYVNKAKKSQAKVSASEQITKARPKKPRPIVLPKHRRSFKSELITGPFARLFGFIAQLLLTIELKPVMQDFGMNEILEKLSHLISLIPSQILVKIETIISLEEILPYLVTYILIEILSALIFSTSISLFLIGATTEGSFIMKRIKAIFRVIISLITTPLLVFDLPLLAGKMTFKEYITRGCIAYRGKFFKLTSLINIILLIGFGIFYQPIITILETQNFSYNIMERANFDESQAKIRGIFKTSTQISENFKFIGVSVPKLNYLLIHEKSSNYIELSEYANINYKDLKILKSKIAFFGLFYPHLEKFLEDGVVDPVNLKNDVTNLFSSGEILLTNDFTQLPDLNIFSMNDIYDFLTDRSLAPTAIKIIDDYNRIYKMGNELIFVTFTNKDIKFLSVKSSYEDLESRIEQMAISNMELFKNPLDQAIGENSNLLSLEEYSANLDTARNIMKESKQMQSMSIYNSFLNSIIKNIPPEKEYIIEYLTRKKL